MNAMNMESINELVAQMRKGRFDSSIQISLGELIKQLSSVSPVWGSDNAQKNVCFDFGSAIPTTLDSWRGSYAELALGYRLSGHDVKGPEHFSDATVSVLLAELQSAIGKTFTGWKGGDFMMDEDTPVWVANPGNADNTAIVGIRDNGYTVVILTSYCEY